MPPVRFVKTIGDAVMLVSTEASALLDAMLALVEVTDADEKLPQLRVGLAYGPAVSRAGDWFGSPVNLASRVTSVARPGSVLVAQAAYEQIGDDDHFTWSFARARRLKGIKDDVKLYRAPGRKGLMRRRSSACARRSLRRSPQRRSIARSPSRRRPATTPGPPPRSPVRPRTTPSPGVAGRRRGRRVRAAGPALFLPCQPLSATAVTYHRLAARSMTSAA